MDTHEPPLFGDEAEAPNAAPVLPGGRHDPLVDSLVFLSHFFGRPQTAEALLHGLPLTKGRLPLDHLNEAAAKAGLKTSMVRKTSLSDLGNVEMPAILLCEGAEACVLLSMEPGRSARGERMAKVALGPKDEDIEIVSVARLEKLSTGAMLLVRPAREFDTRQQTVDETKSHAWFWSAFRQNSGIFGQVLAITVVINLLTLASPLFIMNVYDRVIPTNSDETLWALAIGVIIAGILDFTLRCFRNYFVEVAGRRADAVLANRIFQRVIGAKQGHLQGSSGSTANVIREYETLREFFNSFTVSTLGDLPFLLLFIFVIWVIAGSVAIVPLVVVPLVFVISLLIQYPLSNLAKRGLNESSHRNAVLFESLGGLSTIKSVGAESWAAGRWERAVAEASATSSRTRVISSISLNVVIAAQLFSTVFIVIMGVELIRDREITTGALIAAVILSSRALAPLGQIASVLTRIYQARVAFIAISNLMKLPEERPTDARYAARRSLLGNIEFDHLSFTYPGQDRPTLRDISFKVSAGEKVGIIGTIGSGKSTLLKLLIGLYEADGGALLLDGVQIDHLDPTLLRSSVGYMPQGGDLFSGTIRSNIGLHVPFADDEQIASAIDRAGSSEWLGKLPRGFDTPVGERGSFVSGGQRQSIALARTLLRDPAILALDEPTSEMDGSVESAFIKQMKATAKDKTLLLVTHKSSVLQLVDRLIVLDAGKIVADGPRTQIVDQLRKVRAAQATARRVVVDKGGTV